MFNDKQIEHLNADLDRSLVKTRNQSGVELSYIEGHAAIRAANAIFGFGNWQRNEPDYTLVMSDEYEKNGKTMYRVGYICKVSVTVWNEDHTQSVTTWGTGYGDAVTSESIGKAHEGAIKEAETDAMKRAKINFGDQFGLALYDKDQRHVTGSNAKARSQPAPQQQQATSGRGGQSAAVDQTLCTKDACGGILKPSNYGGMWCPTCRTSYK